MKIGFFTTTYYPTPDGVSHYLRDVKKELEKRGHEVHIFSYNGDKEEQNVHVPITVPFPAYTQYRFPLNPFPVFMYRIARKTGFDVVHIHDPFMGSIGFRLAKTLGVPVIATFHTDFVRMRESLRMPFKDFLIRLSWRYNVYLLRRCNIVLAPSIKTTEYLRKSGIENSEELPLFVDTGKFNSTEKVTDPFIVQYLGRVTKDKGVFSVLDVAQSLGESTHVRFIVSGTGPESENLLREAEKRNLTDRIQFTGYVDENMKLELLDNANLFIYPSETDTFGISVLEALSKGVPAIIPKDFPLTHYNGKGESGMIEVDFNNPGEVGTKILQLESNHKNLDELSKAARSFVTENFSMEKHCDRLLDIYKSNIRDHKKEN